MAATNIMGKRKPLSRIVFDKFDADADGSLDKAQLRELCYDFGYFFSEAEMDTAFSLLDKDGSGCVSYDEFLEWWQSDDRFAKLQLSEAQQAAVHQVAEYFRHFDADRSGELDEAEFRAMFEHLAQSGLVTKAYASVLEEIDRCGPARVGGEASHITTTPTPSGRIRQRAGPRAAPSTSTNSWRGSRAWVRSGWSEGRGRRSAASVERAVAARAAARRGAVENVVVVEGVVHLRGAGCGG